MNTSLLSLRHNRPYRAAISAALLAAAVLLAGLATPLRAGIIDDFSGPKKFVVFGNVGLPEYELNGELHWSFPTPETFGAFLYRSSTYELSEGQPVEFRVDVVTLAHADAGAGVGVSFASPPSAPRGGGRGYIVWWLPDRVLLQKASSPLSGDIFDTSHESSFEPVTLSLTLTRQGSSLKLATKVVRRGEPEQVLFSREVTDRPGIDFTGDNGAPPEGPVTAVGVYGGGTSPSWGSDGVLDNLVCSADALPMTLGIEGHAGTAVMLEWRNSGVLLEADAPAGPWKPWPGVVSEDAGAYHAEIPCSGQVGFYRLAAGEHVLDLFNAQWNAVPREMASPVPGQSSVPGLSLTGARGRIRGTGPRNADSLLYYAFGFPARGDVLASVDIVDWDATMEDAAFGIVLRANPGTELWYPATDGLPQNRYAGLLTFKKAGIPSESVLSLTGPGGEVLTSQSFPAVDPAKPYRLRFGPVGDQLTIELFSLDDLGNETPVKSCAASDGRVVEGMDAMYGTKASGDTYDVTIDRYLFSGVYR